MHVKANARNMSYEPSWPTKVKRLHQVEEIQDGELVAIAFP